MLQLAHPAADGVSLVAIGHSSKWLSNPSDGNLVAFWVLTAGEVHLFDEGRHWRMGGLVRGLSALPRPFFLAFVVCVCARLGS